MTCKVISWVGSCYCSKLLGASELQSLRCWGLLMPFGKKLWISRSCCNTSVLESKAKWYQFSVFVDLSRPGLHDQKQTASCSAPTRSIRTLRLSYLTFSFKPAKKENGPRVLLWCVKSSKGSSLKYIRSQAETPKTNELHPRTGANWNDCQLQASQNLPVFADISAHL